MTLETGPEAVSNDKATIHDCGHGNIGDLEDTLFGDIQSLAEREPDPLAPIGEHIAHSLAWARARSEAERIAALHTEHEQERKTA